MIGFLPILSESAPNTTKNGVAMASDSAIGGHGTRGGTPAG